MPSPRATFGKKPAAASTAKRLIFKRPSRRNSLLAFGLVFAVIGGIILWNRGSAANWSDYDDSSYPGQIYYISGWSSKETIGIQEFNFDVWRMFTGSVIWTRLDYRVDAPRDLKGWHNEVALEICVEARLYEGSTALLTLHDIDRSDVPHARLTINSRSFKVYCPSSKELFIVPNVSDGQQKHISVKIVNWGSGAVDVRSVGLKHLPVIHMK